MTSEKEPVQDLPVAVDAMGGDLGPGVVVDGAVSAAKDLGLASVLVGNQDQISARLRSLGAEHNKLIQVEHASEVITMEESPSIAIRRKRDSSLMRSFELVRDKRASAVISSGNTGAMMAAGLLISGSLPGIIRPAIASLIPRPGDLPPTVLLDSGANVDCHAHQLVQFALMGSYYAKTAIPCLNPRVGLLSNGSEASKGTDITRAAALTLSRLEEVHYIGYVEGRDVCKNVADVVVCDGFIGNILLKTMEGMVEMVLDSLSHGIQGSTRARIGMGLIKPVFKTIFKDKLDPSAYGGAPLLGLNDIAVVCHGSSTSRAIMNAIRVATRFHEESLVSMTAGALSVLDADITETYEDGIWNRIGDRFEKKKKKPPVPKEPLKIEEVEKGES